MVTAGKLFRVSPGCGVQCFVSWCRDANSTLGDMGVVTLSGKCSVRVFLD